MAPSEQPSRIQIDKSAPIRIGLSYATHYTKTQQKQPPKQVIIVLRKLQLYYSTEYSI